MEGGEECNTSLTLSIGGGGERKPPAQFHALFPLQQEEEDEEDDPIRKHRSMSRSKNIEREDVIGVKHARYVGDNKAAGGTRKKLRLGREEVASLEDSFREHNTLTARQKQELASRLNIQPRQVEVWFQNRRARTKLKQTEVAFESLKRCCKKLSEENQRLQKEVEELKSIRPASAFYMRPPKAAAAMCPSCEGVAAASGSVRRRDAFSFKKEQDNWRSLHDGLI